MKKWLAIIMLLSIGYQYMIKLGIVAWYELNKEYVATVLCENKDKPELNCCGKCYLKKQLRKVDNHGDDTRQMPGKQHKIELGEFIPTEIAVARIYDFEVKTIFRDNYKCQEGYQPIASIFHPPPIS